MQAKISALTQATQLSPTAEVIQGWIVDYVAQVLEIEPAQVDITAAFDQYGLDAATVIGLICHLEGRLGYELNPTLLYNLRSISGFSQRLAASSTPAIDLHFF